MAIEISQAIRDLDNPQGHDRLIGGFGQCFSAHAWEGHQHYGPGALVVVLSDVKEVKNSPGHFAVSPKYAPQGSELLKKTGFWPHSGMEKILEEYDPEREVIIIIVGLSRRVDCYSWPTPENIFPPKAHKEWRAKHPIGIRLDPNSTLEECLQVLINYEFSQREKQIAVRKRILSDPAHQASYLSSLIEEQKRLRAELEAGGIGIDINGRAYLIEEPTQPPRNSFERLNHSIKVVEYLATTTAVNRAVQVYEMSKASGGDWLKEAARAGLETYDDKLTVSMASHLSADFISEVDLADDTEEIRKIILLLTAARLRANMKRYPRIQAALEAEARAEGKSVNDILLSKLLSGTVLAWAAYEQETHSPSFNDSNILVNELAKLITNDSQPEREQNYLSDPQSQIDKTADSSSMDFARHLESMDELTAWFRRARLTPAEQEVIEFKALGYTYEKIAEETGRSVGTVKPLASHALRKLERSL